MIPIRSILLGLCITVLALMLIGCGAKAPAEEPQQPVAQEQEAPAPETQEAEPAPTDSSDDLGADLTEADSVEEDLSFDDLDDLDSLLGDIENI